MPEAGQDGPVNTTLNLVKHEEQAEGTKDLETEEGQAEAPEVSQVEEQLTQSFEMANQTGLELWTEVTRWT